MGENFRDYIEIDSRLAALSATGNWLPINEVPASVYKEAILKVLCLRTFFVPLSFLGRTPTISPQRHRDTEIVRTKAEGRPIVISNPNDNIKISLCLCVSVVKYYTG